MSQSKAILAAVALALAGQQVWATEGTCSGDLAEEGDAAGLLQVAGQIPPEEGDGDGDGSDSSDSSANSPHEIMTCPKRPAMRTKCLSEGDYDCITGTVKGLWESLDTNCTSKRCPQADWAGCVLRLAGHDFMDFKSSGKSCQGGSDGCLNFDDPDNKGLLPCLHDGEHGAKLQTAYSKYCHYVSLADFIVLAAEAVMDATRDLYIKDTGKSTVQFDFKGNFRFGRKTTKTCEESIKLPDPEEGCDAVETTFIDNMGLDWAGAAALMGVHTLGRAQVKNSGYRGWWSDADNSRYFNNNYYIKMLANGWRPKKAVKGNTGKNQWELTDVSSKEDKKHQMMLNTDLCLVYTNAKHFNEVGEPVNAKRDNCCAWTASRRIQAAIELVDGYFCGGSPSKKGGEHMILDGGREEHVLCCDSEESGEDLLQAKSGSSDEDPEDCGDFFHPEGPAAKPVIKFANDETKWVKAFQAAWTKATENGAKHLHHLKRHCHNKPNKVVEEPAGPVIQDDVGFDDAGEWSAWGK